MPRLPPAGSHSHFGIIKQWLRECDESHPACKLSNDPSANWFPTRVLDIGNNDDRVVRLWEPGPDDKGHYVALSHPWGRGAHFITDKNNLEQRKKGIQLEKLPQTFVDAILTTRAIGQRYLWIDSLCIIQGSDGEFQAQTKIMERIFSSAYCVLAATRAHGQTDGFLGPRQERDYVTMKDRTDGTLLYVCENIDDFNGHVLNGPLSQRGWAFQEHALARRTVFFAEGQTYWECGEGVRCETLTKMKK